MRYYLIAGEASGDLHGSNLIKAIKSIDTRAEIRCWGGNKMEDAGATLVKHYKDLAFMGFAEVIKNLPTILKNISFCKSDILAFKPDVLVLIDYPGFNLRIAKWAKTQSIKVAYYIAPQVWAWKANRVKSMKKCIDTLMCILPFEQAYFKNQWNWDIHYVGHPLLPEIEQFKQSTSSTHNLSANNKPIIALLPGSRKQEIEKKLPIMLSVSSHFPNYQFVVAKAAAISHDVYAQLLAPYQHVEMVNNQTYELLKQAKAALVTSGTATLETALFEVPQIVCYKSSNISYAIAKRLIKIKFISLVNLIMNKLVVPELIQHNFNTDNVKNHLKEILQNQAEYLRIKKDYIALKQSLQQVENPSTLAANIIIELIGSK